MKEGGRAGEKKKRGLERKTREGWTGGEVETDLEGKQRAGALN